MFHTTLSRAKHHPLRWVVLCVLPALFWGCNERAAAVTEPRTSTLRQAYAGPQSTWPAATLDASVLALTDTLPRLVALERDMFPRPDRARTDLGERLFFDPRLSASNQISCASCHDPDLAWGDGRRQSFGHDRTQGLRNAPSLLNVSLWTSFFWDGRAPTLEEQVFGPLQDHKEMMEDLAGMERELNAIPEYVGAFKKAYGVTTITRDDVARALADYERGIRSRRSRVDRFLDGDREALTEAELRGLHLFRTKARCLNCHHGPLLSDQLFHNSGQHLLGRPQQDLGRYYVTGDTADIGKFRTAMLRDIAYTDPYLHHGNIRELREVLTMYNSGMPQIIPRHVRDTASIIPKHDPLFQPLGLDDGEMDDLLAFLEALSTRPRSVRIPDRY